MSGRLDGRVAFVTGSARGLGAGIAQRLAQEGAAVVCADFRDASSTVASLPKEVKSAAIPLDVTDTAAVEAAIAKTVSDFGGIDILVNNAGVAQPISDLLSTTDETIDHVLAVNLRGVIACSRAAGRIMKERGHGRIISTASHLGKLAWPGWGIYAASKAGVIAITQVLAQELAPYGVTANAICPGTMVTDMMREGFVGEVMDTGKPRDEAEVEAERLIKEKAESLPLGRMGTPQDIGGMVAWLASDDASFTTGAALNLTGGESVFF